MSTLKQKRNDRGSVVLGLVGFLIVIGLLILIVWPISSVEVGTVSVTGSATVNVVPTSVSFDVGVSDNASSATGALSAMESGAAAVNSALESTGVKKKDIQTSDVEVSSITNSSGAVTGFNASEDVSVRVGTKLAGAALDAGARAAGNSAQLSGITWNIGANSPAYAVAREEAVANARSDARGIAAKLGETLGSVKSVVDEGAGSDIIAPVGFSASVARSVPVQAGTSSVSDSVKVVFVLN